MKAYYIKVWEQWEYGSTWGYILNTTDIAHFRKQLAKKYNRFTITEVTYD